MTKLLAFGLSPLPFENTCKNFGPGIRAWQFVSPLIDTTHEILLITARIPYIYADSTPSEVQQTINNLTYLNLDTSRINDSAYIQKLHDDFSPEAILATTIFSTPPLWTLKRKTPVWIDLFGHVLAEFQAKAFRYQDDGYFEHFLKHEIAALQIGDIFSCVSTGQSFATTGELGLLGRLVANTTGYDFTRVIPCAMDETPLIPPKSSIMRGKLLPENAFIVLWSGGYNTWTDVNTLFKGLEFAMQKNSNIWFVSTGGQIDGHDEKTYPHFMELIKRSPFKDRFILKGWLPKQEVSDYYFDANIGINIDTFMYEGLLGSKNRVLDWMRSGLPALIGQLCEISYEFPERGIAYGFKLGDDQDLGEKILLLSYMPDEVRRTGQKAMDYARQHLTFASTTIPFRSWLENPSFAPDHQNRSHTASIAHFSEYQNWERDHHIQELHRRSAHISEIEQYVRRLESEYQKLVSRQQRQDFLTQNKNSPQLPLESSEPVVSVVIVTWNGARYIESCLKSIFDQQYENLEVIVVDNASQDGTLELVKSRFPNARTIANQSNRGFTCGVNQGIDSSSGEVALLLNQDAVMKPNFITAVISELQDCTVAIAGSKVLDMDDKTIQHAGGIVHPNGLTNHLGSSETDSGQYNSNADCDYVTGAAFAFKKSLTSLIGKFDERYSPAYFEELDFCLRAKRQGFRVRYVFNAVILHHESTSIGKFSQRFYYLYHRNRLKFMLKHFPLGYFLTIFRKYELNWLRKNRPRDQFVALIKAYLVNMHRFVWLALRPLIRRN